MFDFRIYLNTFGDVYLTELRKVSYYSTADFWGGVRLSLINSGSYSCASNSEKIKPVALRMQCKVMLD